MDKLTLRVAESPSNFVGRGIAAVSPKLIQEQGWRPGEVLEINGTKKTYAKLWPIQTDNESNIIRIDGLTRNNAGTSIDYRVTVQKTNAKTLQSLTIYPTEPLRVNGGENYLAQLLDGRVVSLGSAIALNIMGRRVDLITAKMQPKTEAGIISGETQIQFTDKAPKLTSNIPKVSYEDIGVARAH